MSLDTTIPKIWSARILENLKNNLVYANLLNRNYEGEIKNYGDTVKIFSLNDITVKKYIKNTEIETPETLSSKELMLVIDQSNYFNFYVDIIDMMQSRLELVDKASANAAYMLSSAADKYIANLLKKGTAIEGLGDDATPITINKSNAYDMLVKMKVILDKKNVPAEGRWVVFPPEYEGYMLLDPRFAYNTGQSENRLVNGKVARAAGFDIYISNNVPNTDNEKYKVIASWKDCGTYAEQIVSTEIYKPEKGFGNAVKGLHVFGAKILRPEMVTVLTANFKEND